MRKTRDGRSRELSPAASSRDRCEMTPCVSLLLQLVDSTATRGHQERSRGAK